jgi:putative ABC transport system permease protein
VKLSGIRYIYASRLEARAVLVQEGFAIVGIAVGVALLFAAQVSGTSLTHSVAQLNNQFVGKAQVQIESRGTEGFPERVLSEARAIPGVQVALPVFERQVNVIGPHHEQSVDLIGVDPHSVRASGKLLRRFSAKQLAGLPVIALPAPLAQEIGVGPLEAVKLQIGATREETLVGATLGESDIGGFVHSPVAVTSIRYAQHLADAPGTLTRVFIHYNPAREAQVHTALAALAARENLNFEPGTFDSRLFAVAVAPESKSEELFSVISAFVGFMFALNAMLITVPSRRKHIEDIRPHGASRWMTVQILLLEAAVIGALACVLGLILGDVVSIVVFHTSPTYLAFAFPVGNNRLVSWQSVAVAVGAGMGAAAFGVLWPVRSIIMEPLEPSRDPDEHRKLRVAARLVVGALFLAVTTLTLVAYPKAAVIGNLTLLGALICLMPLMFDALIRMADGLSKLIDGMGSALAATELLEPRTRVRSLAIALTAAVAVFGIVEFQGTQTNLRAGLFASAHDLDSRADIWITPSGRSSLLTTTSFAQTDTSALARVPGVARLSLYRGGFINWRERRLWVLAPSSGIESPVPVSQVIEGNPTLASARLREGGWAVLSEAVAAENHVRIGQAFTLPSPRPIVLRLAALTTNLGWPPGVVMLNSSDYARGWASNQPSAYEIKTTLGTPVTVVRERLRRVLSSDPGLTVETSLERQGRHDALAAQGLTRLTQIRLIVLISAILAIVLAMGAMIWQRRERIDSYKVQGYQERVLRRWLVCETAILLSVGCSIGAVFGLYAQLLGSHFLATVTGFPIVFDVEGVAAISGFALVTVIAVAMISVPGFYVVRVPASTASAAY